MDEIKKCHKLKKVLVDAHVEAEMNQWWKRWRVSAEEHAKNLEIAVKAFVDFLRDHRSQDLIQLSVIREQKDLCSNCKEPWDTYTENDKTFCINCGAEVEIETGLGERGPQTAAKNT